MALPAPQRSAQSGVSTLQGNPWAGPGPGSDPGPGAGTRLYPSARHMTAARAAWSTATAARPPPQLRLGRQTHQARECPNRQSERLEPAKRTKPNRARFGDMHDLAWRWLSATAHFRERQAPEAMMSAGRSRWPPTMAARVRLNGATHRAANHWPYAPDGHHLSPDQMRTTARCGAVTACHAWRGLDSVQTAAPPLYRRLSAPEACSCRTCSAARATAGPPHTSRPTSMSCRFRTG